MAAVKLGSLPPDTDNAARSGALKPHARRKPAGTRRTAARASLAVKAASSLALDTLPRAYLETTLEVESRANLDPG